MLRSLYRRYFDISHNRQKVWLLQMTIQKVIKSRKFNRVKFKSKMKTIEEDTEGVVNEWSSPEDQWYLMSNEEKGYCIPCCQLANGEITAGGGFPVVMKD